MSFVYDDVPAEEPGADLPIRSVISSYNVDDVPRGLDLQGPPKFVAVDEPAEPTPDEQAEMDFNQAMADERATYVTRTRNAAMDLYTQGVRELMTMPEDAAMLHLPLPPPVPEPVQTPFKPPEDLAKLEGKTPAELNLGPVPGNRASAITGDTEKIRREKIYSTTYALKTAFGGSNIGMLMDMSLPEYDPVEEAKMSSLAKFLRGMVSFFIDTPFMMFGAAIPKYVGMAGAQLRSVLLISRMFPTAEAMGVSLAESQMAARLATPMSVLSMMSAAAFQEGSRVMLMDAYDRGESKKSFLVRLGSAAAAAMKGAAYGAISGKFQIGRESILGRAVNEINPTMVSQITRAAELGGSVVGEAASISAAMAAADMHIPTAEDFGQNFALMIGMNLIGTRANLKALRNERLWQDYRKAFETYATNPSDITYDALHNTRVAADLLDPTTSRIRDYEAAGGNPHPEFYDGTIIIEKTKKYVMEEADRALMADAQTLLAREVDTSIRAQAGISRDLENAGIGPSMGKADLDRWMSLDTAGEHPATGGVPATSGGTLPGKIVRNWGDPIPRYEDGSPAIPTQIIKLQDGREIEAPINREHSSAYLDRSFFQNVDLVRLAKSLMNGHFPGVADRLLRDNGILGYFRPSESVWELRTKELRAKIMQNKSNPLARQRFVEELRKIDDPQSDGSNPAKDGFVNDPANNEMMLKRELFKDPRKVIHTLTHEIGHLGDWFSEGHAIERGAFIRNLAGVKNLIGQVFSDPDFDPVTLHNEGYALSLMWRPEEHRTMDPGRFLYRNNTAEIYADVTSLMLQRPDFVEKQAPGVWKAFNTFLDNRPEFKSRYEQFVQEIRSGENARAASHELQQFMSPEDYSVTAPLVESSRRAEVAMRAYKKKTDAEKRWMHISDRMLAATTRAGDDLGIVNKLQRLQGITSAEKGYNNLMLKQVWGQAEKMGMTEMELREYLFHRMNVADAGVAELPRAMGYDTTTSAEALGRYEERFGLDNLQTISKKYWDTRQRYVVRSIVESGLFPEGFENTVVNSPFYHKTVQTKYLEEIVSPKVARKLGGMQILDSKSAEKFYRKGSLEGVLDPFAVTLINDSILLRYIAKTEAIRDLTFKMRKDWVRDVNAGRGLTGSDPVFTKREWLKMKADLDAAKPTRELLTNRGMIFDTRENGGDFALVTFPERVKIKQGPRKGEYVTVKREFYIPEVVDYGFHGKTDAAIHSQSMLMNWARSENRFFRLFVIGLNTAFQTKNIVFMDPARTTFNYPGVKYWEIPGNIRKMATAYKQTAKAMYRDLYKGELDPVYEDLMYRGVLSSGVRYSEESMSQNLLDHHLERLMLDPVGQSRLNSETQTMAQKFTDALDRLEDKVYYFSDLGERLGNESAARMLNDDASRNNLSQADKDIIARTQLGSPPYMIKGMYNSFWNTALSFFNATWQSNRFDFKALKRAGLTGFAATAIPMAIVPGIVQGLMESGAFDGNDDDGSDSMSTKMAYASESQKSNAFLVPTVKGDNGKYAFVKAPVPRLAAISTLYNTARVITKKIASMAKAGDPEAQEAYKQIVEMSAQVVGGGLQNTILTASPSPAMKMVGTGLGFINEGLNDTAGASAATKMRADYGYGVRKIAEETAKIHGVSKFITGMLSPDINDEGSAADWLQHTLDIPGVGGLISSFVLYTDSGLKEEQRMATANHSIALAGQKMKLEKAIRAAVDKGEIDPILITDITPEKQRQGRSILKSLKENAIVNPYLRRLADADGVPAQKVALMQLMRSGWFKAMPLAEQQALVVNLRGAL